MPWIEQKLPLEDRLRQKFASRLPSDKLEAFIADVKSRLGTRPPVQPSEPPPQLTPEQQAAIDELMNIRANNAALASTASAATPSGNTNTSTGTTTSSGSTTSSSGDTIEQVAAKALGRALMSNRAVDPLIISQLLQGLVPSRLVTPAAMRSMAPSMWDMYVGFLTQTTGGTIRPEDIQWQIGRARPASLGSIW